MSKIHTLTIALLLSFEMVFPEKIEAEKIEVDNIYYLIKGESAAVTYRGEEEDGWMYFSADELYVGNVIIPDTIFYDGKKYPVTTIAQDAFAGSKYMTNLQLPKTVTTIGSGIFSLCSSLQQIFVDEENPKFQSYDGIMYTKNPTEIYFVPRAIWGDVELLEGITKIPSSAFQNCAGLTSITLPESVLTIEDGAFADCGNLTDVFLNENLTTIGEYAFSKCYDLSMIKIPTTVKTIKSCAFVNCTSLYYVLLYEGIETIGKMAFYNCQNIVGIQLPSTLKSIADQAFDGCVNLATVLNNSSLDIKVGSTDNGYVAYYATEVLHETTDDEIAIHSQPKVLKGVGSVVILDAMGYSYHIYDFQGRIIQSGLLSSDSVQFSVKNPFFVVKLSPKFVR